MLTLGLARSAGKTIESSSVVVLKISVRVIPGPQSPIPTYSNLFQPA